MQAGICSACLLGDCFAVTRQTNTEAGTACTAVGFVVCCLLFVGFVQLSQLQITNNKFCCLLFVVCRVCCWSGFCLGIVLLNSLMLQELCTWINAVSQRWQAAIQTEAASANLSQQESSDLGKLSIDPWVLGPCDQLVLLANTDAIGPDGKVLFVFVCLLLG
jgi:hypothetical protein